MREIMKRNDARAARRRELHLHADRRPRRRVPRRRRARLGFDQRAAAVRAGDRRPGRAAARHPRADPLLRRGAHERPHVYLGEARRCARTSTRRSDRPPEIGRWPSSSPSASGASRSTRRRRLRAARGRRAAGLQRVARPAAARRSSRREPRHRWAANRYPDPTNARLRAALGDRYGVPAKRIAIGNGSCDILLAAGEALLEPGAELVYAWPSFSVYPHLAAASGATGVRVPLDADEPRPRRDGRARSRPPRAWSSSATPTTRRRPRCRSPRSRPSSSASRATSA